MFLTVSDQRVCHARDVAKLETESQQLSLPTWKTTLCPMRGIVSGMATIRKGTRLHYYIKEWIEHLGLTDDQVASRMGLSSRSSVWKLYTEQHRLTPGKVAQIADALDRDPKELLFPPDVPSLDAMAEGVSKELRAAMVTDIARRMRRAG